MRLTWDDTKYEGFDFETSGTLPEYALQPWRFKQGLAWPTSFVSIRKTPRLVKGGLFPTTDQLVQILEEAIRDDITMVGWNTVFDLAWLYAHGLDDLIAKLRWLDGMLIYRHYFIEPEYEEKPGDKFSYSLKPAVEKFLPQYAGYSEDVDFHSTDPVMLDILHKYNIRDSRFTLQIAKYLFNLLTVRQKKVMLLEAECLPLVAQANLRGMKVDTLAAAELHQRLTDDANRSMKALAPHGVDEKTVRSPVKLARVLFDEWKLPVYKENRSKLTGNTTRSTDKEVIYELGIKDPRVKEVGRYRDALNLRGKFALNMLKSAEYNGDGHTHPGAFVFGTYSGRFTYASTQGKGVNKKQTGFALHQMKGIRKKGDEQFRSTIVSPEGYTLLEFDAAGQEFRGMAIASGDEVMLSLCAPGEDPHSYMGAQIDHRNYQDLMSLIKEGDPVAKGIRQLGKVGNLSLQYRTSPPKLRSVARVQYDIPMELPEAKLIHATYQRTYPRVPIYWEKQIAMTKRLGYVETFAGRRVVVVGDWSGRMGWSMGSTSINYRIQGTGADQKYLAMAVLKNELRQHGCYFAWDLHDGIYLWVPDEKVAIVAPRFKRLLDNLPYKQAWDFVPPISLPWDCKIGTSWGNLKEYKFGG